MITPRIIERFNPEKKWEGFMLPEDGAGDRFLPLSEQTLVPPPVSREWPGDGVALHVMPSHAGRSVSEQLSHVLREGFISPRRYATFSTRAEMGWGGVKDTAVLVYRTPYRWTREFVPIGEEQFHYHVEGMIGLGIEQARKIAQHGSEYHLEYCSERRRRAIMAVGILAYVPPEHCVGVLRFRGDDHHELPDYQRQALELVDQYSLGLIEEDAVGLALAKSWSRAVDLTAGLSDGEPPESLFVSIAAAYTAAKLFGGIQEAYHQTGPEVLKRLRPSYPLTRQICETGLSEWGK